MGYSLQWLSRHTILKPISASEILFLCVHVFAHILHAHLHPVSRGGNWSAANLFVYVSNSKGEYYIQVGKLQINIAVYRSLYVCI